MVNGNQVTGFSSAFEVNGGVGVGVVEFPLGHDAVAFGGYKFPNIESKNTIQRRKGAESVVRTFLMQRISNR